MENNNWIKLNRKLLKSPLMKKPLYGWLWIVLLLKANHEDSSFIFNNKKQICKRGELITGRKQLSIESGISESQVEHILKYFESEQQIEQQKNNKFRLILIKNYEQYQSNEQQIDNKKTTNRQQIDTNKNIKNIKNIRNINNIPETSSETIPNLLEDNQKHIKIIGLYAKAKKINFESKEQVSSFIKRNLRASKYLTPYSIEKIIEILKYLINNADFKWTLESVGKYIDEDLTKISNKSKIDNNRKQNKDNQWCIQKFGQWYLESDQSVRVDTRYYPELLEQPIKNEAVSNFSKDTNIKSIQGALS